MKVQIRGITTTASPNGQWHDPVVFAGLKT